MRRSTSRREPKIGGIASAVALVAVVASMPGATLAAARDGKALDGYLRQLPARSGKESVRVRSART